ncbi:hypothetical protein V8C34DRAFT_213281 [Trichoderma compactum]
MDPPKCMTETDWLMGLPIPDSETPSDAVEGFFVAQPQLPLDQISERSIEEWEASKSRLEFARLLNYDGILGTRGLLSQYLGFSDTRHFSYFADFIVPRVLSPLIDFSRRFKIEKGRTMPLPRRDLI